MTEGIENQEGKSKLALHSIQSFKAILLLTNILIDCISLSNFQVLGWCELLVRILLPQQNKLPHVLFSLPKGDWKDFNT